MLHHDIFPLNPNLAALLLVCLYSLLQSLAIRYGRRKIPLFIVLFLAALAGNILLQSVSGIAALLACAWWHHRSVLTKKMWWLPVAGIVAGIYCVNTNSLRGRWHILTISAAVIKDHFPRSAGNYTTAYNHYQASYFHKNGTHLQTAWLADEGAFALNEWLQLAVETGLPGILILLALHAYFIQQLLHRNNSPDQQLLCGMLLPFYIFIQCSYPLRQPLTLGIFVLLQCGLLLHDAHLRQLYRKFRTVKIAAYTAAAVLLTGICFTIRQLQQHNRQLKKTIAAWNTGHHKQALHQLVLLEPFLFNSPEFIMYKAQYLLQSGFTGDAISYLQTNHVYGCGYQYHILLGNCFAENGLFNRAEKEYTIALNMVPHKLAARHQLMVLFQRQGQPEITAYWAKQIIRLPVKTPTYYADFYKKNAAIYLGIQ